MSSESNRIIFHGSRVLLPDLDELVEASIVVDADRGTILSVVEGPVSRVADDYAEVVEAGDNIILPGLVESVSRGFSIVETGNSYLSSPQVRTYT